MINKRIRELRLSRGMSQPELAAKLGVSKQYISNWENDNIQPSIEMLIAISRFFMVSTDYLLGIDNKKYIEVSMLTEKQIAHIQMIIEDISAEKK
ncbi:MAG: helix-turn-helix transcriptional regulator [Treponema porcinum]|uniref:helix-turn-helix domain-containing protein n=1 Tax=Treponema porcinum TaxID=261392 RepID=UPI002357D3C5|nr:helix-turn-helix transcriptional regulator [Treponema porcinum]MCI6481804.1 helix-turn-helix domain-containing protein [Treponema porcinum]MDD7125912.1 helix-turn-helix transcriptional regulator [Treponema porcinum]MDY5121748.1 helix-turn-helix transcriptional regulator [Treponema porcinum]MDY5453974.1 helix-turn-helix transcriptional regulator [Treponema porcinum]